MKIKRLVLARCTRSLLIAGLFLGLLVGLGLRAQEAGTISLTPADVAALNTLSAAQLAALINTLEATPTFSADSVPAGATFYSLQNPTWPPLPCNTSGSPVWSMGGSSFLLNDVDFDYTAGSFGLSSGASGGRHAMDLPGPPGGFGDGGTNTDGYDGDFTPYTFDTNGLWLEITNVAGGLAWLNLHHATNEVYAIWSTTDLLSGWQVETEVWPTNPVVMPFTVPTLDRQNLFMRAEDWTGVTENGNTTPDWWFWEYFGTTALSDTNLDTQGNTLLHDYQNGIDPNVIQFTILSTNRYVHSNSAPVQLTITGGVPSSMAFVINDTNFASATWQTYPGSNALVPLGTNDGDYTIWIGLRGRLTNSQQTWAGTTITRDTVAPVIGLTNPVTNTVFKPIIQLQGYVSETLASFTYNLSNAAGLVTNQLVAITGEFADTNLFAITTNYFQAYDVPLASGSNAITLRATDLAGNVTTTNLTFILDYTGYTNAPAITITYPLTNSLVASSNFTLLGHLDDDTATLLISNNAGSQIVNALVERGGSFSAANLSLTNATNHFTLIATNAAGNISTQQLTILASALTLTVDPLSADQLSQPAITVSGSISDTNQQVWVNGSAATLSGNAWSIDLPAPSGNALTFLVQAGSDLSTPLGDLSVNDPMPPIVQITSYSERYSHNLYTTCDGYDTESDSADGNVWALGSPGDPPSVWQYCSAQTDTHGAGCDDGVTGTHDNTKILKIGSQIQLVAGGPAEIGVKKLIRLTAAATPYTDLFDIGADSGPGDGTPVPGSQIQLFGQTLTPTVTNANVGEMYLNALAGSTSSIPYKVSDSTGASLKNYSITASAEEVKLQLTANSIPLDFDNTSNAEFCVGQQVTFVSSCQPALPTGTTSQIRWLINPDYCNKITTNSASGGAPFYSLDPTLLTNTTTVLWWYVRGGQEFVQCTWTNTLTSGQTVTVQTQAHVSVYRPVITEFIDSPPSYATNATDAGDLYLQLGDSNGHGDMQYRVYVYSDYAGQIDYTQLINRSATNGSLIPPPTTLGDYYLDNIEFYLNRSSNPNSPFPIIAGVENSRLIFADNPGIQDIGTLLGGYTTSIADQFIDYVVFRPNAGNPNNNIYISLGKTSWGWSASTTYSSLSGWSTPTGPSATRPSSFNTSSDFPYWSLTYTNSSQP